MKIEKDKRLYICSAACLLFVCIVPLYIQLATLVLVFVSYLCYVYDPTTFSVVKALLIPKQLSSSWNTSSFDSMHQQNSLATYSLSTSRTFSNTRRSAEKTYSFRESDTENPPYSSYCSDYDSKNFSYRPSDETSFSIVKMKSHTPNRSFNTPQRSAPPKSPWGLSVSPKLRNDASGVKTVQTVAGPLLASTRFNTSLDSGLFGNVISPGLSSRIAHSARENAEVLTHQTRYDRPGDFPLVQLDRSASRLPTLSPRNTHKLSRTPVTVRIAPPESSELRYSALLDRSPQKPSFGGMDHNVSPIPDQSTKSLLEALKEISRKRIHAQLEENEDEIKKRQCKGEIILANGEQQSRSTPVLNDVSGCKRMREESPEELNVEQANQQTRKRINNNEILSSLSSSRNLLKFMKKTAKKRKSTADLSTQNAPAAKKQSRHESPSDSVSASTTNGTSSINNQNTSTDTVNSPTFPVNSIAVTDIGSPTKVNNTATLPGILKLKNDGKASSKWLTEDNLNEQRVKNIMASIANGGLTKAKSGRLSLSRAPTLPLPSTGLFSEETLAKETKTTSDDSKTSNTEVKDSTLSITKSPSSANVFGLVTSVPNTTMHNTSTATSVTSVAASSIQTSTSQSTGASTAALNPSPFSNFNSPIPSDVSTSLKTSVDQSATCIEQPTTKTDINVSPGFVLSTPTSNVNVQTSLISLPTQTSTGINFGATQATSVLPNCLPSVKSSIFATSPAEQPVQTAGFVSTTITPSKQSPAVQFSAATSNDSKSAEVVQQPTSSQLMFGAASSVKDTATFGSSPVQSTQTATLFGSPQVQATQASSVFGSSSQMQSTQFTVSPQVQSTQATVSFGLSPSLQSNQALQAPNSSLQAVSHPAPTTSQPSALSSQPSAPSSSLFNACQTPQQTSINAFPSLQSSAPFGSTLAQPQTTLPFGGSTAANAAQPANIFGSKQTDVFKTSSANQSEQAGKLFGTSTSAILQPAQTASVFAASSVGITSQAAVFGTSGTTGTTAGSNVFASSPVVSSTQNEVKSVTNLQPSTVLQTKSSFVLPSATLAFGSSPSPAQNTGNFLTAKSTSETDSGVGTFAANTTSLGFGSTSSKPSSTQSTFSFGGATPSSAASQVTSVFGTPTSQATPKLSAQASLGFGATPSQSNATFGTPQIGTAVSGGFGSFSASLVKSTSESTATTSKNIFASAGLPSTTANTSVFGTQSPNVNVFGGAKADEKPAAFSFGSTKPNGTTNIFQSNSTPNQSNVGGFKFEFTTSATSKENATGTSGQTTTPAFQFGTQAESKPTFGFGGASTINNTLKPATGGFGSNLFGSTPTTTSSTTPQSNVFGFGAAPGPNSGPTSSTNNAFGFGATPSAPSTSGTFTFGSTSQPSSSSAFSFGSAQTTTSTAQTAPGAGGLFNTGTTPAFQFGNTSSQAGSTGGFNFGSSGSSAAPLNFTAGPSSSSSTFQPAATGNMFSIGSGSTGPRARAARSRRQR